MAYAQGTLYEEERKRISNEIFKRVTSDSEAETRNDDYHRYHSVHEGEQWFFADAYSQEGDEQHGMLSTARTFDEAMREPVLEEGGSKSERKKKRRDYEAARKTWEIAMRSRAYYNEASELLDARIVEERQRAATDERETLSIPKDYDEVMASDSPELAEKREAYQRYAEDPRYSVLLQDENRWIDIPLASLSEEGISGTEYEEDVVAARFYGDMFEELGKARELIAQEHEATRGRDAESQKIYSRLARRLAEAANSYALNEREIRALRKIDPSGLAALVGPSGLGANTTDELINDTFRSKIQVQKRVRSILQAEIATLGRLIAFAGEDEGAQGPLAPEDERYLANNGIDVEAFRGMRGRREGHVADIRREEEEERRRQEAEERRRREELEEAERLRLEALAAEQLRLEALEAERRRLEEERLEADRKRREEENAARVEEETLARFNELSQDLSEAKDALSTLARGAIEKAHELRGKWAKLNLEILSFTTTSGYVGELRGKLDERVAQCAEAQNQINQAVDFSYAAYLLGVREWIRSNQEKNTETRVDYLVDAEASEYCNQENRDNLDSLILHEVENDREALEVVEAMNAELDSVRRALEAFEERGADGVKLSRDERIAYMKKLDEACSKLEGLREALRGVDEEADVDVDDAAVLRKRGLHKTLLESRAAVYDANIMQITANRAALMFVKQRRAIRRRTNIDRNLPKTADDIRTQRLERVNLGREELNALISRIRSNGLTTEDIETLRGNFEQFLTVKYRKDEDIEARLRRAASAGANPEDMAALEAAARYIITTEDKPRLMELLVAGSAEALTDLNASLDTLDPSAEAFIDGGGREAMNTVGEKLSALNRIARKNLIAADYAVFTDRIRDISKAYVPRMKEEIKGTHQYTDSPLLDQLLLDSELHPGILLQLGQLETKEQGAILNMIYGDTKGALAAVDKLLIGREELDDLAIFLKMKILKRGAAQGQDPDEGAVYSMTAAHDASRLTRTFRGLLMGVKKQNPKNLVVTDRMDQLYHMDDKTLVESLLLSKAAKDFPGMEFMYLNAYALILSAEAGHQVDAAFINNTKAGQAYPVKTIEAALSSGLATEEQYDKASILLKEQMSVYDSNSLGNRVLNFVGNLIGRDLSRERLGLRALDGLIGLEDQPDARELQFALARKTYKINFPVSFDPSGANLMRRVVENTKEGTLFKDDLGHQLDLAAGAVRYNEKMEEAAKARADDIRRRREAAEAEKQGRIKDLRERDREQRTVSNYQEYNLEAIDRLIAARDSRREELIQAKRAAAVSGSAEIAALVLGMTALSAEAQALLGITYERLESDDFKKWDALVEIGKSISKKLGGYFDLAAMTRDPVDRGGDVRDKSDAFMKKLQEFIGFSFKLPFFRSKLSDADIEKRAALADSMNAMFQNPEFLSSAKAALQLSMENHAIDGVALARGLFTSGKGQPSEVEGNIVTSVAQSIKLFDKEDAGGNLLGPSEVRRLRGSAVAADKLRDARLRRIADQNIDDAHRKTRSPELAIAINGLHALLDRLNYVNEESAGISIRTAIDKIFKDVTGVFAKPFNLMSMTVDADALDEDEGRRRAEFLTQADKVRKAQTLYDLKEEASKFLSYIERNDLRELAYAAMMVDSVPITLKELNRYVNTMSELQDFDKEKAALKKYYRVTFDDKVNRFKGAKAGGQLVNEARLDRKAAGIEDDENGVALALAIGAINALLAMSDKTDEHSSWTDERDAFKALFDRIPAKKNLLAMTASKDDSKEPQEIKDINADFDAIFTFVTEANDWPEFSYGMHMLQDFLQLYQLTDRAHAVMTMEAPATQTVRDMDLTETFGKPPTDPSKLTGTDKMLYEIRTAIGKQYADMAVPAMTRKLGEAANADESGADMVFRARDERRFKYGIKDTNVEGATLALTVLAVEDMATFVYSNTSGTGGFFIAGNPEDGLFKARNDEEKSHALVRYGEAFGALRDRMGHLFNLEAMTSSQSDKLDGTHVQRLREDYKYLIDALANTNTEKDFHANARKLLDFSLAHRLKPRAEAAIAMKATKKTFDEKLDNAVGKASNTNGELWAVREGLKQSYAGLISTEVVSPDNPDALLSSDMKERLGALTQITVLGVFRTILPAMPFADFIKELKEPESEVYRLSSERLSAALAAANFKKKDLSGNAPAGSLYRPLAKRGTEGEPSEKSLALAHHLVKGFSSAVGDSPKEWLRTNASKQQSQSSFAQSLAEDKLGKEAGAMHKQLVVSGIIDKLASNMPRDSVLSIANYVGGSAGLSAALSGIDGEFDLGLTRENDLNVEHGGDDSWRVYVGGKLQSKIAASIGASAGLLELEAGVTVDLSGASGMRLEFANEENCKKFLRIFFTGGSPLLDALEPKAKPETAQGAALDPVREALQLSERIIPVKNYEGNIKLETSVSVAGDAPNSVEDAVKKLAEITGLSDLMQKAKAKTVGKASEKIGKKVAAKSSAMVGAGTVSGAVESAADTGIGVAKNKAVGKVEGALKGKMVELGFEDMGEPEEGEATKLHDLSLAASLSIGGKHETEKIAANKDKVTVSVDAEASSKVSVAMFGAGLSEEVERKFSASLERSFTDSQMTGAVMTRTYEIGGESAAADSRRVLSTFGITNVTIERDLEGELSKYDKVSMIIDAELTREGLAKYQEAARENNSLKTMVVLSDRKNYRNSEIRIEVPANESNYEKFLNQQVGAEVLGEGGKVKLGFKFGARGTLIQYWRYNAAMRKAGPQRLSA